MASTFSGLEWGLGSQLEIEARHGNESTRSKPLDPVVSDKGPSPQLFRKELPQRGKVVKRVKCLLGRKGVQYMWTDTWADSERESSLSRRVLVVV